jgi:uncharacterized RDD family membrane protein YckC
MFCNKCGTENKKEARFCKDCGERTEQVDIYYGHFWIRFGAYFIDFLGVIILAIVIGFLETIFGIEDIISQLGIFGDYVVWVIYSVLCLTIWSTTPGKKIFSMEVLKESGERLDFATSFKRALLQPLSLVFFGVGYWNMSKNDKQQSWHDKNAHTIVVGEKKENYISIFQPHRWDEIVERLSKYGKENNLSQEFIFSLIEAIHIESIQHQSKMMNLD